MSRSYCQIANARFQTAQVWKRAKPCSRQPRITSGLPVTREYRTVEVMAPTTRRKSVLKDTITAETSFQNRAGFCAANGPE